MKYLKNKQSKEIGKREIKKEKNELKRENRCKETDREEERNKNK